MAELFIGITSWNDAAFLHRALPALLRTLIGIDYEIVVCDNASEDGSRQIITAHGARCITHRCRQGDALNLLLAMSSAPYTLLLHSDVIMIDSNWFPLLRTAMTRSGATLISPEDIGLGNMLRAAYHDRPESSFMFFDTAKALTCRTTRFSTTWLLNIYRYYRCVHPFCRLNLYTNHLTHELPEILHTHGQHWLMMNPLPSRHLASPWFTPAVMPGESWGDYNFYDYGFGNFYLFEGVITHYHNWYARILGTSAGDSLDPPGIRQMKQQFCEAATQRFFRDYDAGELHLPMV